MKKEQFKRVSEKLIYKAHLYDLKKVKVKAPDGHFFKHEVIVHPGAAVIVPMLSKNEFILIRQYRTAMDDVLWEFPAGTLEKGEAPLECAKREIIEETGYQAKKWSKLGKFYPAPGISTELMHLYLAADLKSCDICLDRDEFIETKIVTLSRLKKMVLSGEIVDAKTIICFYYYLSKNNRIK